MLRVGFGKLIFYQKMNNYTANCSPRHKISEIFNKEEITHLTARSDLRGWSALLFTWGVIALVFVALAYWPNPLTWVVSFIILGGRQLSLAILMHDASHSTLFHSKWLNNVLGDYLCGSPIGININKYRKHHLIHHTKTGTEHDTDLSLSLSLPTTSLSLARKFVRDLCGLSGIKREIGLFMMHIGLIKWTVASDIVKLPQTGRTWRDYLREGTHNLWKTILFHLLLFTTLTISGHPWLYLAWIGSFLTTYSLFIRIRSMAEHACTAYNTNMFENTRSTRAGFLARATVAPLNVNYHIEHHVMPAVPYFRLPAMHAMLRERGLVGSPPGYLGVLKIVCTKPTQST